MSLTECYVCHKPGEETFQEELDGRVHIFYLHRRKPGTGPGRPKKCDAGYRETETEFMEGLENVPQIKSKKKLNYPAKYTVVAPDCTTRVLVEMYLHTCQRCGHSWTTKIKTPAACAKKGCVSKNWNMLK